MPRVSSRQKLMNLLMSVLLALSCFTLTACSQSPAASTSTTSSGQTTAAVTRTITDCDGRQVNIPDKPQRIACLYAATAHLMAIFNAENLIIGAPEGVKRDILMSYKIQNIDALAVPFQDGSINIEELARIRADLALVRRSTAQNPAEVEKLNKMGIPYVVVDFTNIAELKTAISVVGAVLNKPNQAGNFLQFFDDTLELVSSRLQGIDMDSRPRVYHAVNEAARTDSRGDICTEITSLAGVINVSIDAQLTASEDKYYTTLEQIYQWDPDFILANDSAAANYMLSDSKWQGLAAIRKQQVFTLPVGVSRWCHPGSIEPHMAVLFIARQFYPERFTDLDIIQYTEDYYSRFFGLDLDKNAVVQILSGRGMRLPKGNGN